MKLTEELKSKIDKWFKKITPEQLLKISKEKYGLVEETNKNIQN
jgi:hypothetical protein